MFGGVFGFLATDSLTCQYLSSERFSRMLGGVFGFWTTDCLT